MTTDELKDHCVASGFEWAQGEHAGQPGFFLRAPWLDRDGEKNPIAHITLEALETIDFPAVKRFVIAGRDVSHFTRIVGYLSRVQNWNQSKIGELKDRQRGRYSVEHTIPSI